MKFDVIIPGLNHMPGQYDWAHTLRTEDYRRMLSTIDSLRYDTVLVAEHLGMPHHEVPRLGGYWMEALTMMTFAAAVTETVRIDSNVLVLPYHHPLRLAKSMATIDVLSGGRLNISLGVGHAQQEFAALGIPFDKRGAMTDEILAALKTLWSSPEPEHRGEFFEITGLAIDPKPVQSPHPPIFVGGNSKPALRRAARHDGWQPNPIKFTLEEIPPLYDYLRSQPVFAGKETGFDLNWIKAPAGVRLPGGFASAGSADLIAYREQLTEAYAGKYADVGVTRTAIAIPRDIASLDEYLDYLRWFAEEVAAPVKAAAGSRQTVGLT